MKPKLLLKDLPPGPFNVTMNSYGFAYIVDANGKKLATLFGTDKVKASVAALIIKAREVVKPQ